MHCWVASEAGKDFVFAISTRDGAEGNLAVKVDVDGVDTKQLWLLKSERRVSRIRGVNLGKNEIKAFCFSIIELTEETDDEEMAGHFHAPDIGTMTIKFLKAVADEGDATPGQTMKLDDGPIYERCKKGGTHRVRLADRTTRFPEGLKHKVHSVTVVDNEPPLAVIHFKYRPREVLQADGIIETATGVKDEQHAAPDIRIKAKQHSFPMMKNEPPDTECPNSEEISPAPSSTLYEISRSPSIVSQKRKREPEQIDAQKRLKVGCKLQAVVSSASLIKEERLKAESDMNDEVDELDDDNDDALLQLKAQRDAIDRRIESIRLSRLRFSSEIIKREIKPELVTGPTTFPALLFDANGVIDLTDD
ncbi:hypothetical protein M0805_007621 [Coniferiporia weirii]|nr:hypothetical protein M0805_007621 [Coniferiporia weirii]